MTDCQKSVKTCFIGRSICKAVEQLIKERVGDMSAVMT